MMLSFAGLALLTIAHAPPSAVLTSAAMSDPRVPADPMAFCEDWFDGHKPYRKGAVVRGSVCSDNGTDKPIALYCRTPTTQCLPPLKWKPELRAPERAR